MRNSTLEKVFNPLLASKFGASMGVRVPSVFLSNGKFKIEQARAPTKFRLDKT